MASVSEAAWVAWRRIITTVGVDWRPRPGRDSDPELWYLRALAGMRSDPPEASERRFADLVEAHPGYFNAMEDRGLLLDRLGQREAALAEYERARRRRHSIRRGMPDRPFFMRHRTTSA